MGRYFAQFSIYIKMRIILKMKRQLEHHAGPCRSCRDFDAHFYMEFNSNIYAKVGPERA